MFNKRQRVDRNSFDSIMSTGKRVSSGLFLIRIKDNYLPLPRFAVVVSKKISKSAVKRHFVKRKFVSAIKGQINLFEPGKDFVFIVSKNSSEISTAEIADEIKKVFHKKEN